MSESYPTECSDIKVDIEATHTIYPYGSANNAVLVSCMSSSDGDFGRLDGSVDFYRNGKDYTKKTLVM